MKARTTPKNTPRRTPKKSSTPKARKMTPKSLALEKSSTTVQSPVVSTSKNEKSLKILHKTSSDHKENRLNPISKQTQAKLNNVYKLVRRRTGTLGGGGAGGAIYGEVTQKSFARIVDFLKSECELDTSSTFIDIGAGLGKPNLHVALDPGVKASVGVELGGERWWQSQDILWHGFEKNTAKETGLDSLHGPIFLAHADFLEINSLNDFSHVYMFDKGFPPALMDHIAHVFNSSPNSQYLMCFKKPRVIIEHYEFQVKEIGRVRTSMSGSGESNTCYFYQKLINKKKNKKKNKNKNKNKKGEGEGETAATETNDFVWNVPAAPTDPSVAAPVEHTDEYGQVGLNVAINGTLEEYREWLKKQVGTERSSRRLRSRTAKK